MGQIHQDRMERRDDQPSQQAAAQAEGPSGQHHRHNRQQAGGNANLRTKREINQCVSGKGADSQHDPRL
jgi:hypothetical protein